MVTEIKIIDNRKKCGEEIEIGDWIMYKGELCFITPDNNYGYLVVNINTGEIEQEEKWLFNIKYDSIVDTVEIKIS